MERKMRSTIVAGLMLAMAAAVVEIPTTEAQVSSGRNPWCIRDGALGAGSWDCAYRTFEQCRFSAQGAGGSCSRNPEYRGGPTKGFNPYTGRVEGDTGGSGGNSGWGSRGRW
jgi:Protein of unknown function (DUF3551)